jgi:hypothetical protein
MFAAVSNRPSIATPGRPTPTGASPGTPAALPSRLTRRSIDAPTRSGVAGLGVAIRSRSDTNEPAPTSTTAALMPLPPTSMPKAIGPLGGDGEGVSVIAGLRSS